MTTASDLVVWVRPPGGSWTDISDHVLYPTLSFESQIGAMPGMISLTAKDEDQTLSFTTGTEIAVDADGTRLFGGYLFTVVRTFAFPAADTSTPANVKFRQWELSGTDYNILFDKRVIRNTADYLTGFPLFTLDRTMGWLLLNQLLPSYLDIGGDGIAYASTGSGGHVENGFVPRFDIDGNPAPDGTKQGSWPQQGTPWRQTMDLFSQYGFVYYIDPQKNLHFHAVENVLAGWGFSDHPNDLALPNSLARYGMRDFTITEDASGMVNDAFVWGGSMWSDDPSKTDFKRAQNSSSISAHHRWQLAEVRFGDLKDQGMVTARANVIVSGTTTGAAGGDTTRGLAVEEWQIGCTWFSGDVPRLGGVRQHLTATLVVPFTLYVLGVGAALEINLPLRSMRVSVPSLDPTGKAYLMFEGQFGLQYSDQWWMWKFLRDIAPKGVVDPSPLSVTTGSTGTVYGAMYSNAPTPPPDGANKVFGIPFSFISGTVQMYRNGLLVASSAYAETPDAGLFTFTVAPLVTDALWVVCRLSGVL